MRIEDIDSPRVKPWAVEQAAEDLRWLGLTWDEGPHRQTERQSRYQHVLDGLIERDRVYPCVCTRRDIEAAASAPHVEHEQPIYPGTCAGWRRGESLPDRPFAWRFRTHDRPIRFDDAVMGVQQCRVASTLGDFPVTQKSGGVSYQLAVVVDDLDGRVDQIVRGNDLIHSTFRQEQLRSVIFADAWTIQYIHVPLVRGPDGRRLAKRHGDTRLSALRDAGVPPSRVVRWAAASLGLCRPDDPTVRHADDIIPRFDVTKIARDDTVIVAEDWRV